MFFLEILVNIVFRTLTPLCGMLQWHRSRKKATENFLVDRSLMKFSHFYFFSYFEDNKPEKKSKKPFVMHSNQLPVCHGSCENQLWSNICFILFITVSSKCRSQVTGRRSQVTGHRSIKYRPEFRKSDSHTTSKLCYKVSC